MRTLIFAAVFGLTLSASAFAAPPKPPASQPADVQQQIAELREQVRQLAEAVKGLRAELAALKPAAAASPPAAEDVRAAVAKRRLLIGMTLDDVRNVFGEKGEFQYKSGSTEDWEWEAGRGIDYVGDGKTEETGTWIIRCHFKNGRLASFSKRP